jgi:hypothetical protein
MIAKTRRLSRCTLVIFIGTSGKEFGCGGVNVTEVNA